MDRPPHSSDWIDRLIDDFLIARADGRRPDREEWLARIPQASGRDRFRAGTWLDDFIDPVPGAVPPDIVAVLATFETSDGRTELQSLLAASETAGAFLPRTLSPGTLLGGRFRILEELGRGGIGIVYRATQIDLGREVAIKGVQAWKRFGSDRADRDLLDEAGLLAQNSSRHVVPVYDVFREDEQTFVVMEMLHGPSLQQALVAARGIGGPASNRARAVARLLGPRNSPEREDLLADGDWFRATARIVACMAETMHSVHGLGFVHRDLKPSNVMLAPGGEPILLDFGFAQWRTSQAGHQRPAGYTEGYCPPEWLRPDPDGRSEVSPQPGAVGDPREDVFQLGVILFEMLTLEPARVGRRTLPRRPRAVSPEVPLVLDAIATQATQPDPLRRTKSAAELAEDLRCFLDDMPPVHVPTTRLHALGIRTRRLLKHPAALIAISACLAVPLLVALLRDDRGGRQPRELELQPTTATLDLDRSLTVFAIQVFETNDGPTGFLPLALEEVGQNGEVVGRPADGLQLAPGTHRIRWVARSFNGRSPTHVRVEVTASSELAQILRQAHADVRQDFEAADELFLPTLEGFTQELESRLSGDGRTTALANPLTSEERRMLLDPDAAAEVEDSVLRRAPGYVRRIDLERDQ